MEINFDFSTGSDLEQKYQKLFIDYTLLKQKLKDIPIEITITHNVPLTTAPLTYGVEVAAVINSPLGCDDDGRPFHYQRMVTEDEYKEFTQDLIDDVVDKLFSILQLYRKKVTIKENA